MSSLEGRTLLITGATRGIGRAIALRAAQDGAQITVVGKTATPHPHLPETVFSTCEAIERAGGKALACVADVRSEERMASVVEQTVTSFGGIDLLVNNASAIQLSDTAATEMKRFDLMHQVNARATFMMGKLCLPHLRKARNAQILTLSPPLNLKPEWFGPHLGYSLSKFGMSLCTLGFASELEADGVAANSLWPRTLIATDAVKHLIGGSNPFANARTPKIVADAAYALLTQQAGFCTGEFLLDEEVLRRIGVTDFAPYSHTANQQLRKDLFVEGPELIDI